MSDPVEKQSKGCSNPVVIAAIITGIFAVIVAVITIYPDLIAPKNGPGMPQPPVSPISTIAGTWEGNIASADGSFQTHAVFSFSSSCGLGQVCGTYDTPELGCKGDLIFKGIAQDIYEFVENKSNEAAEFCKTNGVDHFMLNPDGKLSVTYLYRDAQETLSSSGMLTRK